MQLLMTAVIQGNDDKERAQKFASELANLVDRHRFMNAGPALLDLLLGDVNSPFWDILLIDGRYSSTDQLLDLVRSFKSYGIEIPTFILLSDPAPNARIEFINEGIWDCLSMPFAMDELIARLVGIANRSGSFFRHKNLRDDDAMRIGNLRFSVTQRKFYVHDKEFAATSNEYHILKILFNSPNASVSRQQLSVLKTGREISSGALDTKISRLRCRLLKAGANVNIETQYGSGYALKQNI